MGGLLGDVGGWEGESGMWVGGRVTCGCVWVGG